MMAELLAYGVEVGLLAWAFRWLYQRLLADLTFFAANRYFLFLGIAASASVPALSMLAAKSLPVDTSSLWEDMAIFWPGQGFALFNSASAPSGSWQGLLSIFLTVWILGSAFLLARLALAFRKLRKQAGDRRVFRDGFEQIERPEQPSTFTHGKTIFLGKDFLSAQADEREQILHHEWVHARQGHSLDNLVLEVFRCLFWPAAAFAKLKTELMLVHEFEADRDTARYFNRRTYSQLILKLAMRQRGRQLASAFSGIDNRRRLRMIAQARSLKSQATSYFFVLLLLGLSHWPLTRANAMLLPSLQATSGFERLFPAEQTRLVMGFFENRPLETPDGTRHYSHRKLTFATSDSLPLRSPCAGTVDSLTRMETLEANDLRLVLTDTDGDRWVWEGLSDATAGPGARVGAGDTLGWVLPVGSPCGFSVGLRQGGNSIDPTAKINSYRP